MTSKQAGWWLWFLALLAVLAGCGQETARGSATQVIVEIDAESAVRAEAASLRVRVEGGDGVDALGGRVLRLDETLKPIDFPKRLALVPLDRDVRRAFVVTATVYDADGEFVAEARLVSGYVPSEVRYARLLIEGSQCLRKQCEDTLQTCSSGSCVDAKVDVQTLSTDSSKPTEVVFSEPDAASETPDASEGPDANAPDAGSDPDAETRPDAATDMDASAADASDARSEPEAGGSMDAGADADTGPRDAGRDADAAETGGSMEAAVDAGPDAAPDAGPSCSATSAPDLSKLGLQSVVSGLSNLTYAAQAPGGDWYLLQQSGEILVRPAAGGASSVVLDLSAEVGPAGGLGERGLLGIAFAPDFATSGTYYVMLTPSVGALADTDLVRQYQRQGSSSVLLDTLLTLPMSASNHNGGTLQFGPDGMLYVGTGDGGGGCNTSPSGSGQLISTSLNSQLGKILRLDLTRKAAGFAALGNPFSDSPLVYHYGLRNPFRFSFDRATGDLYIGDVGQSAFEEVNFAKAGSVGLNFGWAAFESDQMTCSGMQLRTGATHTLPIFAADRRSGSCSSNFCDWVSVIGGVVYRGNAIPKLKGVYLAGDYTGVRMIGLTQCNATTSPLSVIRKEVDVNSPAATAFQGGQTFGALTAIVEDSAGEVYFVANRSSLLKLVPAP